jgi:hypothetical protein
VKSDDFTEDTFTVLLDSTGEVTQYATSDDIEEAVIEAQAAVDVEVYG